MRAVLHRTAKSKNPRCYSPMAFTNTRTISKGEITVALVSQFLLGLVNPWSGKNVHAVGQLSLCPTTIEHFRAFEQQLLSPHAQRSCSATREGTTMRSPRTTTREQPLLTATRESLCTATKTEHSQKYIYFFLKMQTSTRTSHLLLRT